MSFLYLGSLPFCGRVSVCRFCPVSPRRHTREVEVLVTDGNPGLLEFRGPIPVPRVSFTTVTGRVPSRSPSGSRVYRRTCVGFPGPDPLSTRP